MKFHHKAVAAVLSTGLIFGSASLVSAESASAATVNCAPQDQAVGVADARVAQVKLHVKKAKKHVKKAKKAPKRDHTKASKKLNRKANATLKSRNVALAAARAAAAKCPPHPPAPR